MKCLAILSSIALAAIGCGDNLAAPEPDAAIGSGHTPDQFPCPPGWERSAPDQPCHLIPHFPRVDAGVTDAQ